MENGVEERNLGDGGMLGEGGETTEFVIGGDGLCDAVVFMFLVYEVVLDD